MLLHNPALHFLNNPGTKEQCNSVKVPPSSKLKEESKFETSRLKQKLFHTPPSVSKPAIALPQRWQHQGKQESQTVPSAPEADSWWWVMESSVNILGLQYLLGGKALRLIYYWLSKVSSGTELLLLTVVTHTSLTAFSVIVPHPTMNIPCNHLPYRLLDSW